MLPILLLLLLTFKVSLLGAKKHQSHSLLYYRVCDVSFSLVLDFKPLAGGTTADAPQHPPYSSASLNRLNKYVTNG